MNSKLQTKAGSPPANRYCSVLPRAWQRKYPMYNGQQYHCSGSYYMSEAPSKVERDQGGLFRRLTEKVFGEELSSVTIQVERNPGQVRSILFSFLLSILVKKTIVSLAIACVAFLGLPQIVLVAYAMFNGLPVFDVYEAIGDYRSTFAGLAALFTAVLVVALAFPGWLWSFDKPVRDMNWFNPGEMGSKNYWIRLRWAVAFLPGILAMAILVLFMPSRVVAQSHFKYALSGSVVLVSLIILGLGYLSYRTGMMDKDDANQVRAKHMDWKQVCREPSLLLGTNFASFFYFAVYMGGVARFIEQSKVLEPYITEGDFWSDAGFLFMTVFITMGLLLMTTLWVAEQKPWTPIAAFLLLSLFVLVIHPGASTLLRNYMAAMRVGGGTPVEVSVDASSAQLWPAIFTTTSQKSSDGLVRSSPLSLMLLGGNKIFLKPLRTKPNEASGDALMIERSRIREILFLSRPSESQTASKSPSEIIWFSDIAFEACDGRRPIAGRQARGGSSTPNPWPIVDSG